MKLPFTLHSASATAPLAVPRLSRQPTTPLSPLALLSLGALLSQAIQLLALLSHPRPRPRSVASLAHPVAKLPLLRRQLPTHLTQMGIEIPDYPT